MKGQSGIFTFPFQIYGVPDLGEVRQRVGDRKVRVHEPARLRGGGGPLSPDYPPDQWPDFRWSRWIGKNQKLMPPSNISVNPISGSTPYDGFRVDYWAPADQGVGLAGFVAGFLGWLRLLSGQDWIARYEAQSESHLKYEFVIDGNGRAAATPYARAQGQVGHKWTRPIDTEIWVDAATNALEGSRVPEYWVLFQDAGLMLNAGDLRSAVLNLALSLEVARDSLLQGLGETKEHAVLGTILGKPFVGTDLLEHLSTHLASVHPQGRDVKAALGDEWELVRQLYIARHHVAHGKGPVTHDGEQLVAVERKLAIRMMTATRKALLWLENGISPSN